MHSGTESLMDVYSQLGFHVSAAQRNRWKKMIEAREKRDSIKNRPDSRRKRSLYKRAAQKETGM